MMWLTVTTIYSYKNVLDSGVVQPNFLLLS